MQDNSVIAGLLLVDLLFPSVTLMQTVYTATDCPVVFVN
ncbi:unnamed protein product [Ranitomeya imitator]|uniref:Uncharacterized protein n=1 Tax=Ranitomeya imitator TaxID=111125 RepID=A0ABN9MID8_9NEOB|nr:unnamed protein product [Ranitomeya imitator]